MSIRINIYLHDDLQYIYITELSGQNINLDFQTLYIGSTGTEKPPPSLTSATTANKEVPNFVGHMQHFIFNGQHFFDMARSGQMTNFKVKNDYCCYIFVALYFENIISFRLSN